MALPRWGQYEVQRWRLRRVRRNDARSTSVGGRWALAHDCARTSGLGPFPGRVVGFTSPSRGKGKIGPPFG